ncbi:MAG: diguanylate cyclase [Burkholderiales bacterium]|nr:diguanylate cyclase [Burkholderiales bacterium]
MHSAMDGTALPWKPMLDALGTGVILLNARGEVVYWNAWMARYSGLAAEGVLGRDLESIFPGGLSGPFLGAVKRLLAYRLPVVLSNVLHRAPLPLFHKLDASELEPPQRMPQALTLVSVGDVHSGSFCLIQVTDTSMFVKRERVLQSQSERLSLEAVTDGLTGVYNRKYFDQCLSAELRRHQRSKTVLSLLMLDVDYFKNYNDSYGHPAGDRVLKALVSSVKSQLLRPNDVLARYGGEEFVVILPSVDQAGAMLLAAKVRAAVAALDIAHADSQVASHVTVSVGATTSVAGHCDMSALVEAADQALYAAKSAGRNTVHWQPCQGPMPA